jgi:putative OPT family oligopeptide transporter
MSTSAPGSSRAEAKRQLHPAAYRELKPGETYEPYVSARENIPQFTTRAVVLGVVMTLIFSVAATYSGLKVAQVFEAAIPISILAVGLSTAFRSRRNTILENVIIQSIGGASGLVVAGSIFTLPALYIMNVAPGSGPMLLTMFIVSVLGSLLGLMFLIPLRRYFVAEQHGKLPFPEATAINEVYVTGETGGEQARTLVVAAAVGGVYDFLASSVRAWSEIVNFQFLPFMRNLATSTKATVSVSATSLIVGLGFITGLRFSAIICAGGLFSALILVPLIYHFGQHITALSIPPAPLPGVPEFIPGMSAANVFRLYAQRIGVGAMAGAGIIGIIRSLPTIVKAFSLGFQQIAHRKAHGEAAVRTDLDLKMSAVIGTIAVTLVAVLVFFFVLLRQDPSAASKAPQIAFTGLIIAFVFSFLFTTVAALATAMTGNNPISGMTLVTLIIGSAALVAVGLQGDFGKYAAIVMGAVVCSALAMSGGFVTDLKVGYWLGSTPRYQEISKVIGALVAAVGVALTVLLIHRAYGVTDPATGKFISGFMNTQAVPAPQANLFATILSGIFDKAPVTWLLYGVGMVLAVLLVMMKLPPLAFAIGMYLPLQINTPLFIGGLISHWVATSSKEPKVSEARVQRGTLIASGFIAGGSLMGVVGALLMLIRVNGNPLRNFIDLRMDERVNASGVDAAGQIISIILFVALCAFLYSNSKRAKASDS